MSATGSTAARHEVPNSSRLVAARGRSKKDQVGGDQYVDCLLMFAVVMDPGSLDTLDTRPRAELDARGVRAPERGDACDECEGGAAALHMDNEAQGVVELRAGAAVGLWVVGAPMRARII